MCILQNYNIALVFESLYTLLPNHTVGYSIWHSGASPDLQKFLQVKFPALKHCAQYLIEYSSNDPLQYKIFYTKIYIYIQFICKSKHTNKACLLTYRKGLNYILCYFTLNDQCNGYIFTMVLPLMHLHKKCDINFNQLYWSVFMIWSINCTQSDFQISISWLR